MSADAKAWMDASGWLWDVIHDGDCATPNAHAQPDALTVKLAEVEQCMGHTLRWEIRAYPNGQFGLVGYVC